VGAFFFVASVPAQAREDSFRFEIRGYAQLDYVQAFQGVDPNWEAALRPSRIATDESTYGTDPQATLSVRQSRFGVYADAYLGGDDLHTEFEFDLFGVGKDEGQTTMRPRQIFGRWKWLLAGQTNSLFMDGDIFPNVIEYWGPTGMVLYRNPQLRLTPISGSSTLAVAIERPGTVIDQGALPGTFESRSPLPDLTAAYSFSTPAGHVRVAGLLRELAYRTTSPAAESPEGSTLGLGAHVSSVGTIGRGFPNATVRLSAVYGHGIANYMNDGGTDLAPTASGELVAQPLLGLVYFLDLSLSEKFGASLGYSFTTVDPTSGQTSDAFERGDYASATLLFTPVMNLLTGVSYTWGRRIDADGETGIDQRAQLSVKYSFSSLPKP
jgi:hypothetical protein